MVLSDFRLFWSSKRAGDHVKNPQKHQIFCKFGPKSIKIGRRAGGGVFESGDFLCFWAEFAKYFVFWGIFDGDQGRFDEKMERFCQKESKIGKYHCSLLSTHGGHRLHP
jgi:hypothetical protein